MKIGILTLQLHTNYGGILQAYALQTVLERMGHEVVVLNKRHHLLLPIWKWPYSYPKRIIQKYILGRGGRVFLNHIIIVLIRLLVKTQSCLLINIFIV